MTSCYFSQLFLLDEEQLNKMLEEQLKEKDSQLEIDFEKANAEAKQDEIFSKMTKKELIEYIKEKNIELEKCNESRKCETMIKENLRNKLAETEQKFEEFKKMANEKHLDLFRKYNQLLVKENKQSHIIQNLKGIVNMLEESNGKLVNDYNFLQRLYNGTREACAKWKNEAINYQYQLNKYKIFNGFI